MHKKLAVFGFQENQIQAVLNPKKAADLPAGYSPGNPRHPARPAIGWTPTPTYIKVSRDHLDIETLKYYNLRYEIDAVCLGREDRSEDADKVTGRPQVCHHSRRDQRRRDANALRAHSQAPSRLQHASHRRPRPGT